MAEEVRGFLLQLIGIYMAFNALFSYLQIMPLLASINPSVDPIAWSKAWGLYIVKIVLPDPQIMIASILITFLTAMYSQRD